MEDIEIEKRAWVVENLYKNESFVSPDMQR